MAGEEVTKQSTVAERSSTMYVSSGKSFHCQKHVLGHKVKS